MNKKEADILISLAEHPYENQRALAKQTGYSIGAINKSLNQLFGDEYLNSEKRLTLKAKKELKINAPDNAIILAAGFGMRMIPINTETPKGLLEIHGEPLIERMINQLHEVGIKDIHIVVGFMKEQYEYLIDKYSVNLIVNSDYSIKNNLHSLSLAANYLSNSYIVPCDIWAKDNPFKKNELYSWYMVNEDDTVESSVRVNRKQELVHIEDNQEGNRMVGISYITKDVAIFLKREIKALDKNPKYNDSFWEEALFQNNKMLVDAKIVKKDEVIEINTYEELREIDSNSNQLKTDALEIIAKTLNVDISDITNISSLKKGMTNRSFLFLVKDKKYIMRIPGEGTDKLINRTEEAEVYKKIGNKNICDNIVYINEKNGYKITEFIEESRTCNPDDINDLKICMSKLKEFHALKLKVKHEFDIFRQIDFYESLWDGKNSIFRDYSNTKKNVFSTKGFIDSCKKDKCLTHIDAVPDNFLFTNEGVKLIDWEYAGMQDPHVDIAMFCIYALYDQKQVDNLIDIYFDNKCDSKTRIKIYCYIAACGLLWSNWCEYKRNLGVEFGEYSLRQYRYAKEYYRIAKDLIEKL